jgi:DNA-binding CsgD family transcriptional regulator
MPIIRSARARPHRPEDLTARERQVLQLIWSGLKNSEIAAHLTISIKTVEAHRAAMMKKVRVNNTAQLLQAAIQGHMIALRGHLVPPSLFESQQSPGDHVRQPHVYSQVRLARVSPCGTAYLWLARYERMGA